MAVPRDRIHHNWNLVRVRGMKRNAPPINPRMNSCQIAAVSPLRNSENGRGKNTATTNSVHKGRNSVVFLGGGIREGCLRPDLPSREIASDHIPLVRAFPLA